MFCRLIEGVIPLSNSAYQRLVCFHLTHVSPLNPHTLQSKSHRGQCQKPLVLCESQTQLLIVTTLRPQPSQALLFPLSFKSISQTSGCSCCSNLNFFFQSSHNILLPWRREWIGNTSAMLWIHYLHFLGSSHPTEICGYMQCEHPIRFCRHSLLTHNGICVDALLIHS